MHFGGPDGGSRLNSGRSARNSTAFEGRSLESELLADLALEQLFQPGADRSQLGAAQPIAEEADQHSEGRKWLENNCSSLSCDAGASHNAGRANRHRDTTGHVLTSVSRRIAASTCRQ